MAVKAIELRDKAKAWLRAKYPDAVVTHELSVAEYGHALVDVAAITPDFIHGIEIKGEGDSPARLALQGGMYSRVCRKMHLLCCPTIASRCMKHLPYGWGVLHADATPAAKGDYERFDHCEVSGLATPKFESVDKVGYCLAPVALAAMPWTKEYNLFEEALGTHIPDRKAAVIAKVVEKCTVRQIEKAVCTVLRQRDWELKEVNIPAALEKAKADFEKKGRLL
jgi:hypothetical protein